ncbi:Essential protein Yae1- N-terminal [Striga hermonthica]|uniref:Essential protein Yae1- N-terminal n=1 Tax=Striga hermonthica TaxID=68872 RepID=A0A9N7R3I2_STRHE|nr:Essential protein Yae1- N-terminal [Striga hermonthica]
MDINRTQLQGSIAHDLYSEILQSSSVGSDRRPTADQATNNPNESDADDCWYDDESSYENSVERLDKARDMEREWERRHNQFHTIGYRDGLIAGKEVAAQEGFNIGFKESVLAGYNWGLVRGITSAMMCLPDGLKEKLVETEETMNEFRKLHEHVQSLSTTDALKLFYEDQKRKSENQKESDNHSHTQVVLNHQHSDKNVLENCHRQLQSLLSDTPMLDKVIFK